MGIGTKIADKFRKDANWTRLGRAIVLGGKAIRAGTGPYLASKIPAIRWIPNYKPEWIVSDMVAGFSVGFILLPQAVIVAVLAGVPFQVALVSSWLPGFLYSFMGTTRDLSIGPNVSMSILIGELVRIIGASGVPPFIATSVLALNMGILSLIFGLLNFGFLFDLFSLPVIIGMSSGLAQFVIILQMPVILGITGLSSSFMLIPMELLGRLGTVKPIAIILSIVTIVYLSLCYFIQKKFGAKNYYLRLFCQSRNLIAIMIFSFASFVINRPDGTIPQWQVLGNPTTPLPTKMTLPPTQLALKLFVPSITFFLSLVFEHIGVAKSFSHTSNYEISSSQEMVVLGLTNIFAALFGGMPVTGGDMARASVSSASGSKSPLSQLFTAIFIVCSMTFAGPYLAFLPMPVIASIILFSTITEMPAIDFLPKYWKISFVDFIAFLLVFNLTPIGGALFGMGLGLVIMLFYTAFRIMFSKPVVVKNTDLEERYSNAIPAWWAAGDTIPAGTQVITLETDLIYLNAQRIRHTIMETVYTYTFGIPSIMALPGDRERAWNENLDRKVKKLRKGNGISNSDTFIPRMRILILDFSSTSHVDASGMEALVDVKRELKEYAGESVQLRFVGLNHLVRRRFGRASWEVVSPYEVVERVAEVEEVEEEGGGKKEKKEVVKAKPDLWFWYTPHAIEYVPDGDIEGFEYEIMDGKDMI